MRERNILIFDLDGTLMDTMDGITHAADGMLATRNLRPLGRSFYESAIGGGAKALIEKALIAAGRPHEDVAAAVADFIKIYNDSWSVGLRPFPGVEDLVRRLKGEGYEIVVNTNKGHDLAVSVVRSSFSDDVITDIEGSSAQRPKKPDPAGVDRLLLSMGRRRAEAIYIGDSPVDIKTARQAGMPAVAVTWGYAENASLEGADALVDSAHELYQTLRRISSPKEL